MCFVLKNLICIRGFRRTTCKNYEGHAKEKCSRKLQLKKIKKKSDSYELYSSKMGSNGEVNFKIYADDSEVLVNRKTNSYSSAMENIEKESTLSKSKQSSQTPEYVKRTAKFFESVTITEDNGLEKKSSIEYIESSNNEETNKSETDYVKISLDNLDLFSKKPSYVGVSCSNSGYRNVINYDSKLREGFWTTNNQRGSLVLNNSRLRENSPMRKDFDFIPHNGNSFRQTAKVQAEKDKKVPVNDNSQTEKFVNISTSTKTISTFRNSKDIKANDLENNVNGFKNHLEKESKVNLKQILNGKPEGTNRRGYSNLGFSPKILKSPEKNCNSFLKNISSFENNCKKSQTVKNSSYSKTEQTNLTNSIQQRIERLYGPGALAHGFYFQKPSFKENEKHSESISSNGHGKLVTQSTIFQNGSIKSVDLNPVVNSSFESIPEPKTIGTEKTNGHGVIEKVKMESNECEKNGVYFLKLLKKETDRLEKLASFAEKELENGENLSEEISGKLRAAAGKARLLMSQKLHQFEGLCQKNINEKPSDAFPTTSEDLAGFWDMVMLQVVQVYGVFEELEELKKNNWKSDSSKKGTKMTISNGESKSVKISPAKKESPQNGSKNEKQSQKLEATKKAREEERRKLLEERRKKMKEQKQNKIINNESEIEIFAK